MPATWHYLNQLIVFQGITAFQPACRQDTTRLASCKMHAAGTGPSRNALPKTNQIAMSDSLSWLLFVSFCQHLSTAGKLCMKSENYILTNWLYLDNY